LAKTRELIVRVQENLDAYDLPNACAAVPGYVDTLNNWYIRSRRSTFWADENSTDKQSAYDTLYTVLTLFCRTVAPLLPMIAERIYIGLTRERSVHLSDWPDVAALPFDRDLVETMDLARDVCSGVLAMREAHRRRTRLPLRTLTVAHPRALALESCRDIIAEAINVKEVILSTDVAAFGVRELKVNPKLGAKLGARMKEVFAAQRDGAWSLRADGSVEIAGLLLEPKDFELRIRTAGGAAAEPFDAWRGIVVLDTKVYPDLQVEGWARDLVRLVQNGRKEAGLAVTDRIGLRVAVADPIAAALRCHADYVTKETLAASFHIVSKATGPCLVEEEIDGHRVVFEIERISGE
jgi:isoleucyl-tRNA synthetase